MSFDSGHYHCWKTNTADHHTYDEVVKSLCKLELIEAFFL